MTAGSTETQHSGSGDVLAMTSLASRQDLPGRVRQLLDGVLGLFWRNFERSLTTALDEFERNLIQQANKPRVGEAGGRCLDSVRRIKPVRGDLVPRFMLSLEHDLAGFDRRPAAPPVEKKVAAAPAWLEMSLVGSNELDESLTLREIATKVEARHSVPLYELGYRFGVLAGRAAFDVEALPLGPGRIVAALRYAVAGLDLPLDHRVLFYQTFDRFSMSGAGALYVAANTYLAEQRILRHLQLPTMEKNRSAPNPAEARSTATTARDNYTAPRRPAAKQEVDVGGFGLAMFEVASSSPARPSAPQHGSVAPPREVRAQRVLNDSPESERFSVLRGMLDVRRRHQGVPATPHGADSFEPGPRELQSALSVLQVRSPPTIMLGGKIVQRTVAQLRQDLLNQLRHVTPPGQMPRLSDEDADTIDLAGMLFDQLMLATRANGRTQSLLTRLQVPILRAALRDKRFFFSPDHAARQLLNTVAEAGTQWLDDGIADADPTLIERMQRAIDGVNAEYDTDIRVFDRINEELQSYVQSLTRKTEVSERRLIEACRGREKLALAREAASRAIIIRLATAKPTRLVRTLLEQAWTDVLALTILRQGEKSDAFRKQLAVADQLIAAGGKLQDLAAQPIAAEWREEIESGLSQVGYHADEVLAVVGRLFASQPAPDDDHAISQTDLAMRLKSKMRLGDVASEEAQPSANPDRQPRLALNADETQMLERLKAAPFGTAFDLYAKPGADPGRIRLSWFSQLTGRCLLTSQRGARVDERGLEQLARDIVAGKVRFAAGDREPVVDRCWKAVVEPLEKLPTA